MQAQNREGGSYGESNWIGRAGRHWLVALQVRERRRQPQGLSRRPLPLPSKSAALMQVTPAHPAPAGRPTGRPLCRFFLSIGDWGRDDAPIDLSYVRKRTRKHCSILTSSTQQEFLAAPCRCKPTLPSGDGF